ncbi:Ankyrin-3 [Araneus ventricosus]|uniref:Alpha-latrotoxin n=1 Tax=Araneus ventricosus TaxID=182803 RepID=A0A4Y2J6C8_ARAVE|nr:Ankyrin-3 [Araneus ventricosus]
MEYRASLMGCSSFKWYQPFSGYLEKNFTFSAKSKAQLLEDWRSLDEVGARSFYFEILNEIKNSILSDNVETFKHLSELLSDLNRNLDSEMTRIHQKDARETNGDINLIILACKSASFKILEHLLSDGNSVYKLPFSTGKGDVSPEEVDEVCHNAFYYAIRSNETRILQILIEKWPKPCIENDKLDDILSKAYKDLILRNVYICKTMEIYVKDKLLNLRHFQEKPAYPKNKVNENSSDIQNLKELAIKRIEFVSETITNIKERFWDSEPDEVFILSAKYIAKNLFTLKSCLKFTNELPWEEIEFCLAIFIRCCEDRFEKNHLYHFVLNKRRLLSYLANFSKLLETVKDQIKNAKVKKSRMINVKGVENVKNNEDFKELYSDFSQVRDLYSIETIRSSIDLAMSVDATTKNGQLVIVRVLQVIGEHLKSSKDSPKLSGATSQLLHFAFPGDIKKIATSLRNSLSHYESIFPRSELEEKTPSLFVHMQSDIARLKSTMIEIYRINAIMIIRSVLDKIVSCGDHSSMKQFISQNHISGNSFLREQLEGAEKSITNDADELEQLISNLEKEINEERKKSKELFHEVHAINKGEGIKHTFDISKLTALFESATEAVFVSPASELAALARKLEIAGMHYLQKRHGVVHGEDFKEDYGILMEIEQFTVLEKIIDEKSRNISVIIRRIRDLIQIEKKRLKEVGEIFHELITSLTEIFIGIKKESTVVTIAINRLVYKIQRKLRLLTGSLSFKSFYEKLNLIANEIRVEWKTVRTTGLTEALTNVYNFLNFHMGNIKWIKYFEQTLQSDKKQESGKHEKPSNVSRDTEDKKSEREKARIDLTNTLDLLRDIMCKYYLYPVELSPERVQTCEENPQMRFLIEMLLLDVMSILERDFLNYNPFFLDTDFPIVNGRNLRNHLAHRNVLVSAVLEDNFTNVLLNTRKLLDTKDILHDKLIGKRKDNDPLKSKESFDRDLSVVEVQKKLFVSLADCNFEGVKDCIKKGADLQGRGLDLTNSLHFAAQGPNLELAMLLLKFYPDINGRDINEQTFLHVAAAHGKLAAVKYALKEQVVHVDSRDVFGETPLHLASQNGHLDVVKCLLKHEANTASKDRMGFSPVHLAILENRYDVVLTLLEKEKNADAIQGFYGLTILHLASARGHLEIVEALLKKKADVNFHSDMRLTPLHYAARGGHEDVVKFLIANGADVNATSVNGLTPLHWAVEGEKAEAVAILLQNGASVNPVYMRKLTPLSMAAKVGNTTISKLLLEKGADIDFKTDSKITPVYYATYFGYSRLLKLLLGKVKNDDKIEALHRAAFHGHLHIVELLLEEGVCVHARWGGNGVSVLHIAASQGHKTIVDLLIRKGADIDAKSTSDESGEISSLGNEEHSNQLKIVCLNSDFEAVMCSGMTALHLSAISKQEDTVRLLLRKKADVLIKGDGGITPLQVIILGSLTKLLIEEKIDVNFSGPDHFIPLYFAAGEGDLEFVKYCIQKGCDVNAKNKLGKTALHMAAESSNTQVVNYLLDKGSNINSECREGSTALSVAVGMNSKDIVKILIEKGADICAEKERKLTIDAIRKGHDDVVEYFLKRNPSNGSADVKNHEFPLHTAVYYGHISIVKKLLDVNKEEINVEDNFSRTPLFIATYFNRREIVQLLLSKVFAIEPIPITEELYSFPIIIAASRGNSEMVETLMKALRERNVQLSNSTCTLAIGVAIEGKHLDTVKTLMELADIDLNAEPVKDRISLLGSAVLSGSLEIVKILVDNEVHFNERDTNARPLHWAAQVGHQDIVEYFLALENDINCRGENESTALHYAVTGNQPGVCEFLIRKGLDVNAVDSNGFSPLHLAAYIGNVNVIRTLLQNGARHNALNSNGDTPLLVAISSRQNNDDVLHLLITVELLFQSVRENVQDDRIEVPLTECGCINVKDERNFALLHYAARNGCELVVNILLRLGANPNVRGEKGVTPLHCASEFSHLGVIKSLLHYGATFEPQCDSKKLPVHFATNREVIDFFEFLNETFTKACNGEISVLGDLQKMVDFKTAKAVLRARNAEGRTLTAVAVVSGHPEAEGLKKIFQADVSFALERAKRYFSQGKYDEASEQYRRVLKKRTQIFDLSDPAVLDVQINISEALLFQLKLSEALNLSQNSYQMLKEILGDNNKQTLAVEFQIGLIMLQLDQYQEALEIFRKVSNRQKEILGPNDFETLVTLHNMAQTLMSMDNVAEALKVSEEVVSKVRENYGDTFLTLKARSLFAIILSRLGRYKESLAALKEVNEQLKEARFCHPDTMSSFSAMASVLWNMGKHEEALKAFEENVDRQTAILGRQHPNTLRDRNIMGDILLSQRKCHEALQIYQADVKARSALLGENHPKILEMRKKIEFIVTNPLILPIF